MLREKFISVHQLPITTHVSPLLPVTISSQTDSDLDLLQHITSLHNVCVCLYHVIYYLIYHFKISICENTLFVTGWQNFRTLPQNGVKITGLTYINKAQLHIQL